MVETVLRDRGYGLLVKRGSKGALRLEWRGENDPLGSLMGLGNLREVVEELIRREAHDAIQVGYSWEDVGYALGMTRQGAWQKLAGEPGAEVLAGAVAQVQARGVRDGGA